MLYGEDWVLARTIVQFQKFVRAASPSTEEQRLCCPQTPGFVQCLTEKTLC